MHEQWRWSLLNIGSGAFKFHDIFLCGDKYKGETKVFLLPILLPMSVLVASVSCNELSNCLAHAYN